MAVLAHEGTYPILYGSWPIPVGAHHRGGYIARPDAAGKYPVVIVVQDINGMSSFEKDLCRRLARRGFAAVTLDLYREGREPFESYNASDDTRALADLDELHEFIVSDDVDWNVSDKVGILGTDVGGRFALIATASRDWVKSLVVAYTPLTGDDDRGEQVARYLDHLPVPVLGLYGAEDELIATETVDEAQRRNQHGQWLLYAGAGHGFLDVDHEGFDQASADDAFERLTAFFEATLDQRVVEDIG